MIGESLGLRDFYHVGIAVRNIDDAMQRFEGELGIGRWATMLLEFQVRADWAEGAEGAETTSSSKIAYAPSGLGYVELVEPVSGPSPARRFLDEHGEGAFHLGYWVDDVAEAMRRCERLGIGVAYLAYDDNGPHVAYLDREASSGVHVELVRASMRPLLEAWVAGVQ